MRPQVNVTRAPAGRRSASATLGTSVSQLVRAFAAAFGLTPHAYVVNRRIERSRQLMLAGMPLAEVAIVAGFHDQAHLTRHFKRFVGVTPARYRSRISGLRYSPDRPMV